MDDLWLEAILMTLLVLLYWARALGWF